jgi:hypothetical protein
MSLSLGRLGLVFGRLGSNGGVGAPFVGIQLSAASFTEGAAQGTAIGTLSVVGGSGFYTFTLTDDAGGKVQIDGDVLEVGATVASAGSFSITVHADNGAGSVFDRTFLITVIATAYDPSLDFSDERNIVYTTII